MLRSLTVRNFAIIDRLEIEFGPGFNVLTGETGAGKSILMDALNLILGGRAGSEMVRAGSDRTTLDAVFDIGRSPELRTLLLGMGFELEDDDLLLTREVSASGKSTCRVAGRPATVTQLKEIGDWLVDLHGQHEHQSLLAVGKHIELLDEWGGREIQALRDLTGVIYQQLQSLKHERAELETGARERAHLLDLYGFQVREIAEAKLESGEEEELEAEYRRVSNAQKLAEAASATAAAISGTEGAGALDIIGISLKLLEEAAGIDGRLSAILTSVRSAVYELSEAERDLSHYAEGIELDPERQLQIEERLELIRTLKRKYGDNIDEILSYEKEIREKLNRLSGSEERGDALRSEIAASEAELAGICDQLSKLRMETALEFQAVTLQELRELSMEKARFEVGITPMEPGPRGQDRVEFMIATNPGEPLRPLARVASGGEISRVMLAIKSALARQEALPTMVFDEIDVGVGGRIASVLADKMVHLSKNVQILCITHLAQIASRGQQHFYIEKQTEGERTLVAVHPLNAGERVEEIARMISGSEVTDTVLQHAREMLGAGAVAG